jgi:hypothetical protein
MIKPFLLDTNAYFIFFQRPKKPYYDRLFQKLSKDMVVSFYISEITSMEIQSVLGKYRRGSPTQSQKCNRKFTEDNDIRVCQRTWIHHGRKKMKRKIYRSLRKLISDIEEQKGPIKAQILKYNSKTSSIAKNILYDYADTYDIGSHDAMILASLIEAKKEHNLELTLITSDKAFKSVLREKSIPYWDPQEDN